MVGFGYVLKVEPRELAVGLAVGYQAEQSRILKFWTGDIECINGRATF